MIKIHTLWVNDEDHFFNVDYIISDGIWETFGVEENHKSGIQTFSKK
jgi:hypothetical protein